MTEPDIVFESPADQAGWVQLPNVVLMDEALTVAARLLYGLLLHFARQDGACFPGQDRLGVKLRVSPRSVQTYLRELERAMLVRTERRGLGKTNRYVLLALGLRAKRLADTKLASGQADAKPASGQTGSQLRTTKKQKDEDAVPVNRARAIARPSIASKTVTVEGWALTGLILAEFNRQTGRDLRLMTSGGVPSAAARRIYMRVAAYPDLKFDDHRRIIEVTLASKWWWHGKASGDRESVGVVYGPEVFEENISRKPPKRSAREVEEEEQEAEMIAALKRRRGMDAEPILIERSGP